MPEIRVLLIEDLPEDAEFMQREVLKVLPEAVFQRVENRDAFLDGLESYVPQLILSDYQLPRFDGLSALRLAVEHCPETPFILVTGSLDEETAVECMKAGAWDYILKDRLRLLGPAVLGALEKKRLRDAHRQAAGELRHSEERYRSLFENNQAVMFLIDPASGQIVEANPAAAAFYGWSRQELCRKRISEINTLAPEAMQAKLARARDESCHHPLCSHRLADGSIRTVELFSAPIHLGKRTLLFSIVNDITERTRAEAGWRLAQFCIDHAAIGILRMDSQGRILDGNEHLCASLGYSRAELCALSIGDIQTGYPMDTLAPRKAFQDRAFIVEGFQKRKDGTFFPVEMTVNHLEYEGEKTSVAFVSDISERKAYEKQLEHQATHDALTGLANRALLADRLKQSFLYADRSKRLVAVLLIDLDRFKYVNDSLGHTAGDELIRQVGRCLLESVREADTVARLGGDEFVILFAEVAEEDHVGLLAEKIVSRLRQPFMVAGRQISITPSIGISLYPRDGSSGEQLLSNADIAMYRAKEEGDTFRFYAPGMNQRIIETLDLEADLRQAVEARQLRLFYQPKIDLGSGRINGGEALLRWQHPQKGLLAPDRFMHLAEETGLILPIGDWVLAAACAQVKDWLSRGLPAVPLSINLSARQFRTGELLQTVQRHLRESDIDPRLLELELTESMIMLDPEATAKTLRQMKALGLRLALDDFGTGYSSLNYLRHFPFDCLKIDRSFINDVATDPSAAAVARSIVAIARSLGLHAVAEGVETRAQLEFLVRSGCDSCQGYYFSKPVPAEEFARMLQEKAPEGTERQTAIDRSEDAPVALVDDLRIVNQFTKSGNST